ncbi:hypothetical protein D3C77_700920 [compost metagenome]
MHGGLADGVCRAMRGGQYAIQHRHHDETAAEAEQDRGDAACAAEQSQYEIQHAVHPFWGNRHDTARRIGLLYRIGQ